MPEFLDLHRLLVITHVFGAILGAGGAFVSDAIFLMSVRDGTVSSTEMRFIRLGGRFVWAGLIVLLISGLGLFLLSPAEYLHSSKFLVKMGIVLIIFINGIIFHRYHIPLLERTKDAPLTSSAEWRAKSQWVFISGAISLPSWATTVVLGKLRSLPYSVIEIGAVYLLIILSAIAVALLLKNKLLRL